MKLQFLVPHWDERPEEMTPLLDSLALQQGIDITEIGVVIAYDGPDATSLPEDEWSDKYPFQIEYVHAPKGGVSATRNAALRAATAPYVEFSDADDMLFDMCGMHIILKEIDGSEFDVLLSVFREETKDESGNLTYILHDLSDRTFVHGRVFRREYLLDNDIMFDNSLTIHEDSFFIIRAVELANPERVRLCAQPYVLWKWRNSSVCRREPGVYILKTFGNMIESNDRLVDDFIRRGREDKARTFCGFMVLDSYYALNKPEWISTNNASYRASVERRFASYYRKHESLWASLVPQEKALLSNAVRQRSVGEGMLMEAITLEDWISRVLEKYPAEK